MLSNSATATEMVNWVFPEHAGAPGQIHGGLRINPGQHPGFRFDTHKL